MTHSFVNETSLHRFYLIVKAEMGDLELFKIFKIGYREMKTSYFIGNIKRKLLPPQRRNEKRASPRQLVGPFSCFRSFKLLVRILRVGFEKVF
jgi:hypothetical protein